MKTKQTCLLQTQIESTPFIKYACEKLFPLHTWKLIGANDSDRDQQHLRVLKVFAEMSAFCGTLDAADVKIDAIFNVLQVHFNCQLKSSAEIINRNRDFLKLSPRK